MINYTIKDLPWVKELKRPVPCEALKWSRMPLKALYNHGPNRSLPPTGTDKYKCKRMARWSFKDGKNRYGFNKTGHYCWSHLICYAMGTMDHEERVRRLFKRRGLIPS